jgi:hypothetical protein
MSNIRLSLKEDREVISDSYDDNLTTETILTRVDAAFEMAFQCRWERKTPSKEISLDDRRVSPNRELRAGN